MYLLRTRNDKMPYKHIAAHLHKTELACRLHYHQMAYGNARRKRTISISSAGSSPRLNARSGLCSVTPIQESPTRSCRNISPPSPPRSVVDGPVYKRSRQDLHQFDPSDRASGGPTGVGQKTLLPAPADLNRSLRLDTTFVTPRPVCQNEHDKIDFARLCALYRDRRQGFWSSIASQYSPEGHFSASQLESAFLAEYANNPILRAFMPPTPDSTPKVSPDPVYSAPVMTAASHGGFHAINTTPTVPSAVSARSPGRCAVSALLNEPMDQPS